MMYFMCKISQKWSQTYKDGAGNKKKVILTNIPYRKKLYGKYPYRKTIWEVYFKYTLSTLHLHFRSLKSDRSML